MNTEDDKKSLIEKNINANFSDLAEIALAKPCIHCDFMKVNFYDEEVDPVTKLPRVEDRAYRNIQTDEEVKKASISAHAHHFIKTLPDGYNMVLNEETNNISAGQIQLLTIARAMLRNPKVLILDEATSNVDTRTEVLIQQAMDELIKNRTTFIIAHRLSTIKNADLILVMKDGDIIETGNHEELMKQNGFYKTLYNSQFEE